MSEKSKLKFTGLSATAYIGGKPVEVVGGETYEMTAEEAEHKLKESTWEEVKPKRVAKPKTQTVKEAE